MNTDKADIKVVATQKDGATEWRMAVNMGMAQGPGHYPKLPVGYDHDGQFTFKIMNSDTTFAASPIEVQKGTAKPQGVDGQFTFTGAGTQTLTVHDSNKNDGDYNYVLHFSDGTSLDPIIQNGGCCHTINSANYTAYAISAVAIIALLVLVLKPLLTRRAAARDNTRRP